MSQYHIGPPCHAHLNKIVWHEYVCIHNRMHRSYQLLCYSTKLTRLVGTLSDNGMNGMFLFESHTLETFAWGMVACTSAEIAACIEYG